MPLRHFLILILVCLGFYLPGLSTLPVMDRDEARFAQASKQMVETGDYVDIRFQETARHKKPVGIYWLQAASVKLFSPGDHTAIWAYRLPSLLGAILAVLATYLTAAHLFDRRTALFGACLLAGSLALAAEAHLAKTDAMLLATIAIGQYALARLYVRDTADSPDWAAWLFWAALGCGILIKGPLPVMIAVLTVLAIYVTDKERSWLRNFKPITGLLLCAAIVAPWVIAMSMRDGGAFLEQSVGGDLLPKLLGGQESHGAPPGYHTALLALTFWPGSLFLVPALIGAWRCRREPAIRFLLAWVLPAWLIFEAVPTKLPHYTLPVFPALAILAGALAAGGIEKMNQASGSIWARGAVLLWACIGIALGGGILWGAGEHASLPASLPTWLAAISGLAAGLVPAILYFRRKHRQAGIAALVTAALALGITTQFLAPTLDKLFLSPRLATAMAKLDPTGDAPKALSGFHEPSAVFLIGTQTRLTSPEAAADLLQENPRSVVAIETRRRKAFLARATALDLSLAERDTIAGLNYSKGREVSITIFTRTAP